LRIVSILLLRLSKPDFEIKGPELLYAGPFVQIGRWVTGQS